MREFPQIPYPFPLLPEETHVDEKGRIWFSRWTLIGFLEHYYQLPEEDRVPSDLGLDLDLQDLISQPGKKRMTKYHSNI